MTFEHFFDCVSNNGLAIFIVLWGIFRLDKFLTFLCAKLEVYNHEFAEINSSIKVLTEAIKHKDDFKI